MTSKHLDLDTYRRLRAGRLDPRVARELAAHLDEECETCEAFLAGQPPDDLDGAVDAALTRLAPPAPLEPGDDQFARIERALRGRRRVGASAARWVAAAAALVLVVGVGVTALRQRAPQDAPWDGMKGRSAQVIPARLRFAVVDAGGGAAQLDRGRSGAVVPAHASLAFRAEIGSPAYLALLRIGPGETEVVWRQHVTRPGAVDVSEDGRPAAYPLRGLTGTQRFALVASEQPLREEDLAAAARAASGASASSEDRRASMALDVVEVTIR